ncbi:MAG TPA: carboxypeptidase-like regulatory domain-containing protein [Gaiellales bacterium]|nr:carboxypeptidase-like regulatory domain-containing protein [Gaiellales bacterium]
MKWSPATTVLAMLLAAGCSGGSTPSTAGLVSTDGVLVRVGGPPPGAPVALTGVVVRFRGAGRSALVRTDRHGRFSFDGEPGTYRVTITRGGPQTDSGSIQPFPRVIHVPHTGRVRLVVNIK